MRTLALLAFGLMFMASSANAQGFDCAGRLAPDEAAICDSGVLQRLDEELNNIYEDALAQSNETSRQRLRDEQREWIATRGNCRRRESCIEQLYRDRIAELEEDGAEPERAGREVYDGEARWAALGVAEADDRFERLVIPVGFSRGRFDALQFRVRDARVRLRSIVVRYGNGQRHRMRFRRSFFAGEISDLLELRPYGRGRFIENIVIVARTVGYERRSARIEVAGRRLGRGAPRRGPFAGEFDPELDRKYQRGEEYGSGDDPDREYGRNRNGNSEYGRGDGGEYGRGYADDDRRDRYEPGDQADLNRDYRPDNDEPQERSASSLEDRMLAFVKNDFHRTAEMTPGELRQTYASRVDYYGERNKPISGVIADKQNYAERWTDRAFRVHDDTLEIKETRSPDIFDVTYRYDFHVRGDGRESKGEGVTTLRIDTSGDRFVILSEHGKVTKRL